MNKPSRAQQIANIANTLDEDIDYQDAPELPSAIWQSALDKHFKPIKKQVTVRIDADLLDWLKTGGKGYQTRLNDILRHAKRMEQNNN